MRRLVRYRPSPAMVVALVALFLAMGGTSSAILIITSANIKNGTIRGRDIHRGTIPFSRLKAGGDAQKGLLLRGTFDITGGASGSLANSLGTGDISFGLRFKRAPTVHIIPFGASIPFGCDGTPANPRARRGHACVFITSSANAGTLFNNSPTRQGVTLFFRTLGPNAGFHVGNWAAAAP